MPPDILKLPIGCSVVTLGDVLRDWCARNGQDGNDVVEYVTNRIASEIADYAYEDSQDAVSHYIEHNY